MCFSLYGPWKMTQKSVNVEISKTKKVQSLFVCQTAKNYTPKFLFEIYWFLWANSCASCLAFLTAFATESRALRLTNVRNFQTNEIFLPSCVTFRDQFILQRGDHCSVCISLHNIGCYPTLHVGDLHTDSKYHFNWLVYCAGNSSSWSVLGQYCSAISLYFKQNLLFGDSLLKKTVKGLSVYIQAKISLLHYIDQHKNTVPGQTSQSY